MKNAYKIYMIWAGATALAFNLVFTVNMIYQVEIVGLNPLQLVLIGTMLESTIFLFEVPTGVVADVYSRRLSVIIGTILIGMGFITEALIPTFAGVLFAQFVWGFGYTFISGASQAWLADEIGEDESARAYLRESQLGSAITAISIPVSVFVASVISLQASIIFGGLTFIATGLFLIAFMPENGFTPTPREERNNFRSIIHTTQEGVKTIRNRPSLLTILAAVFVFGAFTEGYDRLFTFHFLENFTFPTIGDFEPVVWFGLMHFVSLLIGIGFTEILQRRVKTDDPKSIANALIFINTLLVALVITFALTHSFALAVMATWAIGPLRGLIGPIQTAWINKGLNPQIRATVLSMYGQTDAMGQVIGGPGVGYIGNLFGVRAALALGGIILSPVPFLYRRTLRINHSERESSSSIV